MTPSGYAKKLIEVALPLAEINVASAQYKGARVGTIRNLHKWFAAMPLPAWRALLFAALVDDPDDDEKRAYLLDIIKRLVANGADLPDASTLDEARRIIAKQFPQGVPTVMDPFCGGGSTLVEAQRLGLPTYGSDLNPVPVLITRTLTEILPRVYGQQPLHPELLEVRKGRRSRSKGGQETDGMMLMPSSAAVKKYTGYDGLVRDITHYAERIRDEAWEKLKDYYPIQPGERPVAWLWARTAKCRNPTCGIQTVLTTSWWLSKRKSDLAWIDHSVEGGVVHLNVVTGQRTGTPAESPKIADGVFLCLGPGCGTPLDGKYLRQEGKAGRLGIRLVAVVVEVDGQRTYRSPGSADTDVLETLDVNSDSAAIPINSGGQGIRVGLYGMETWDRVYTPRQLLTLTTFADCVAAMHEQVLLEGGTPEWADAVITVLALTVGKTAQNNSSLTRWKTSNASGGATAQSAFGRNDLPMSWDFAETFACGEAVGSFVETTADQVRAFKYVAHDPVQGSGAVRQDARVAVSPAPALVAADPPYFEAIGYADHSDYFYVWHRRALRTVHPDLYGTLAAPKVGELTAIPSHHGNDKRAAREYFISGFTETFKNLQRSMAPGLPLLVVYASKEQKGGKEEESRWSSILTAMVDADLEITGTWPIHGTSVARMIGQGTNAVAAYVVMVCRPRPATAGSCSLADFNRSLRRELKSAVRPLQAAGVLPVDLAQAAMGPGMQIFSRYREVLDQKGERVPVDRALRLINAALGEVLDEQEGELDPDSRFSVAWWEKHGWQPASFGEADQLARPQGISVDDVVRAGVATYPKPGFVGLLGAGEMDREWKPSLDGRPTAWEAVHHLADRLIDGGGELDAGRLMSELGVLRDPAQALVYRLHDIAAKQGRAKDQERYNALIGSWSGLLAIAASGKDELF